MKYPQHVAIIMDGNRRWAEQRGLPVIEGHRAGAERVRPVLEYLGKHGVKYLTIYGFSTENWSRGPDEVFGLFDLFVEVLNRELPELNKKGVRICHLGRLEKLPVNMQKTLNKAVEQTIANRKMTLNLAINYGGRQEIVDAARLFLSSPQVKLNEIGDVESACIFDCYLYTKGMPDVDLVIRTGGEFRLSNFLLWQIAYSEFYFTKTLWPDFSIANLSLALQDYAHRKRRFGGD